MMNVMTWRPPEPHHLEAARLDPPRAAPRRAPRPSGLDVALAERDTVIVLVVGADADADQAERCCRGLARDPGFEAVRVVRVRDRAELSGPERACWLAGERPLTILGPDRVMALPLERADAVDLFVAVAALA
jgi:hypothetical protein